MYCNNCGAEIRDGMNFCEQCGNQIKNEIIPEKKEKSKRKSVIIAAIVTVLLLTIGIGVVSQTGVFNPVGHNLKLGYKYLEEGKYEEALLAFNKVLEIDENNIEAVIGASDAYVGLGRFDDAVDLLNLHIAIDNTKTELYDKLIDLYIDKGDYASAKGVIEDAEQYGYEFNINSLDDNIKSKITNAGANLTGFQTGWYVVETNSKVISVDEDGVKVRNSDSEEERVVLKGKFASSLVSDGEYVYLYAPNERKLKELKISTGRVVDLTSVYTKMPVEGEDEDYYEYGSFSGYCDGKLYFQESYGSGDGTDFIYDLKSKAYKEMKTSSYFIGTLESYKNKIYYDTARTDASAVTVYEANADGSNEKILFKNVMNFTIIGNTLYYTQMENEYYDMYSKTKLKSYNLDTKETNTIKEVTCSGWVYFTDFGYGYGQTSEDDVYGIHIDMPNGAGINKKGFIENSGMNYMICREIGVEGSITQLTRYNIVYNGKMSETFTISSQAQVIGYFGGKVYYYDYSQYGGLETITPVFN